MLRVVGVAVVAGLVALGSGLGVSADTPQVGARPPEIDGQGWINVEDEVSLKELDGKVVVVEFWATWCGPCRRSIPHLIEVYEKHKGDGLVIVGLSNETKEKVEPFVKEMKIPYVIGYGSTTGKAYGVTGIPCAFVIGADGNLVWTGHPMKPEFEKAIGDALAASKKSKN
jgi:thiol-disulfide isomerase/thioredoxin